MEASTAPSLSILDYVQSKRQQFDQRLDALQLLSSVSHHNGSSSSSSSSSNSACNASCPLDCKDSLYRVDSSEWLESFGAFVPLSETTSAASTPASKYSSNYSNYNGTQQPAEPAAAVSSNGHGNYTYAPPQQEQWRTAAPSGHNQSNDATAASLSSFAQELRGMAAQQSTMTAPTPTGGPRRVSNNELYVVSDRLASILPVSDDTNSSSWILFFYLLHYFF